LLLFLTRFNLTIDRGPMTPLPGELLGTPIQLFGACAKVKIVEWRALAHHPNDSGQSKIAIAILDSRCNFAVENFQKFLASNNIFISKIHNPEYKMSLIPWDPNYDGR